MEKKKIEIGAVINFCRAKSNNVNKAEIFRYFGVSQQTGNNWFPGTGSSDMRQLQQPVNRNGKRTSPHSVQETQSAIRKNPVRNGGRDQKRLKSMIAEMQEDFDDYESPSPPSPASSIETSSSSSPEEPVTPPRRRIAKAFEKSSGQDGRQINEETAVDIKSEEYDDEVVV